MTEFAEQDDADLMFHICRANHAAFAELVHRHVQKSYGVAYRLLGDRDEAEDIVQSAFLKLWEQPDKWNPKLNTLFSTWFYRVIVNLCLDWQKKKKPVLSAEHAIDSAIDEKQQAHKQLEEQLELLEVQINALPERQRTAINLCYRSGLSNQEAADVMLVSLKALQSLLARAKTNLKRHLQRLP